MCSCFWSADCLHPPRQWLLGARHANPQKRARDEDLTHFHTHTDGSQSINLKRPVKLDGKT